jgi:hypothetical protein
LARTGRPKGTGIDDSRPLLEMAREQLKHPELKVQTLARQFTRLAEGNSEEAIYRRLASKFRKRRAELMAKAKESLGA